MRKIHPIWIATAIVVVAIVGGFLVYRMLPSGVVPGQMYKNDTYGISFTYPDNYTIEERDVTAAPAHHAITITDTKALANVPQGGEGPTSITLDIYPANGKDDETWITTTKNSNFNLSVDKQMHDATIAGTPAVAYTWDGLYRGNSFVFAHKGNIMMASVTYMTTDDTILGDFTNVLKSVKLY